MALQNVVVDTNIFLEVLQGRARADECLRFLKAVRAGRIVAFLTDLSLHGICHLMGKASRLQGLSVFLSDITTYQGLQVASGTVMDCEAVVRLALAEGLRFDDAYQLHFARRFGAIIVSFDHHFDGRDPKRLEPGDVLQALNTST